MRNHFHLVLETPLANLSSGMKWLLGTYTSRFNRKHRYFGSLFSGRYKAIIVDGSGDGYLRTVCDYVHLNPVRAKLLKEEEPLKAFRWSSYPEYLKKPDQRPAWHRVDRLLGEMRIPKDSAAGRGEFKLVTEERRRRDKGRPEERKLKRTWCLGDEQFKRELLKQMHGRGGKNHYGSERQEAAEAKAQRILKEELRKLGWTTAERGKRRKGDSEKVRIGQRLRKETTVTLKWVAEHLQMGSWSYLANQLYACQKNKK